MKKRIMSLLLVSVMLMTICLPAYAADEAYSEQADPVVDESQEIDPSTDSFQEEQLDPELDNGIIDDSGFAPSEEPEDIFNAEDAIEDIEGVGPVMPEAPEVDSGEESLDENEQLEEDIIDPFLVAAINAPTEGDCGDKGSNVKWSYSDGTLRIYGSGAMRDFAGITDQPWRELFYETTSIIIEEGITHIGDCAFYMQNWADVATAISIPNSVTSIGEVALSDMILTSLTIPKNVAVLGDGALEAIEVPGYTVAEGNPFYVAKGGVLFNKSMTKLLEFPIREQEKYTIPDSVTTIGTGAFTYCEVQEIIMPSSVIEVEPYGFNQSRSIKYTLGSNLKTIGECAFYSCEATEIVVPRSVEKIGYDAFSSDYIERITILNPDCVIEETTNLWGRNTLGKPGTTVIVGFEASTAEAFAEKFGFDFEILSNTIPAEKISGEFKFSTDIIPNGKYTFYYDDSWFYETAYNFQIGLTRMSMRVALAAFQSKTKPDDNIRYLYDELGYNNIITDYPTPQDDSIGYAIASKNVEKDGETISIICVAIRGGGYGQEWAGNFNVGVGIYHAGFDIAANTVVDAIDEYINDNEKYLADEVKIWVSGFSRAAATANLVGYKLDEGAIDGIKPENVFAYCFESPQPTRDSTAPRRYKYSNITSVLNPIDLVPKVAPSYRNWDFTRYGVSCYVPGAETVYNYDSYKQNMLEEYEKILAYNGSGYNASDLAYEHNGQASFLNDLIDTIAEAFFQPLDFYPYQQTVQTVFRRVLGNAPFITDASQALELGTNLVNAIRDEVCKKDIITKITTAAHAAKIAWMLAKDIGPCFKFFSNPAPQYTDYPNVFLAHFPELCLAWVDSLERINFASAYRKAFVNCPVDVYVYDSNNTLVGKIIDGEHTDISSGVTTYTDVDGQYVLILPADEEFTVRVEANDSGTLSYAITEYDVDSSQTTRVTSYCDIAIQEGDVFVGEVENLYSGESVDYALKSDDDYITPTVDQSGSNIVYHSVTVSSEGNGAAAGCGTFVQGEYCRVWVESGESNFIGWYIGSELVSSEKEYRLLVDSDINVLAKFEGSSVEPTPPSGNNGWLTDTDGKTYYYKNGKAVKGWNYIDSEWYYFDDSGRMVTGDWAQDSRGWYFLDGDGKMMSGFREIDLGRPDDGWYYFNEEHDGSFGRVMSGWIDINGNWYYFNEKHDGTYGRMVIGDWAQDRYGWYFLDANGKMMSGFSEIDLGRSDDGWYYFNPKHDGSFGRVLCGWQYIDGDWYYFNEKHDGTWGRMVTGNWARDAKYWYFLGEDGKMLSGLKEINLGRSDDGLYYFNTAHDGTYGRMMTGWQTINGNLYYFETRHNGTYGAAFRNSIWTINGWFCAFDEDGVCYLREYIGW